MPGTDGETKQEVLERSGVSDRQLKRWRRRGLVPSPEMRSQGHAAGMRSTYPPGTAQLCKEIDERREQVETLDDVAWWLWFEGRDRYTEQVRSAVLGQLEEAQQSAEEQLAAVEDEGEDSPLRYAQEARDPWGLAGLRGKVGRKEFPTAAYIAIQGFAGELDKDEFAFGVPPSVRESLETGIGLLQVSDRVDGLSDEETEVRILELFKVFSLPELRRWIREAPEAELLSIRDEAYACFQEWAEERAENEPVPRILPGMVYAFRRVYSETEIGQPFREIVNMLLDEPESEEMGKSLQRTALEPDDIGW